MYNNRRGRPEKSIEDKKIRVNFSITRRVYELFINNTYENGDDPNQLIEKNMATYNDLSDTIENQSLVYERKDRELKAQQIALEDFREKIQINQELEIEGQKRFENKFYLMEIERLVTELKKRPSQKKFIPEKAQRLSIQYHISKKYVLSDIDAQLEGRMAIQTTAIIEVTDKMKAAM